MSIEKAIAELTQAVLLNTRSVDLLNAQMGELNSRPEIIKEMAANPADEPISKASAKEAAKSAAKSQPKEVEEKERAADDITDEEVKALPEYSALLAIMNKHMEVLCLRNGNNKANARTATLDILADYTEDKKAATLAKLYILDSSNDAIIDCLKAFDKAVDELEKSNVEAEDLDTTGEDDEDDFGDEGGDDGATYTDEDLKQALRAYAKVEGKPAAIAALKAATGSATVAGVNPADYGKAVKALQVEV